MKPERWIELLTEVGEAGLDLITFSGGDPHTYPEIDQLMAVMARYHMNWLLPTKSLITRQRAEQLTEFFSGSRYVQISVDSFEPEIAEMMTRTPNYSKRARTSISNLVAARIPVRTNTVVTPFNLYSIDGLVRELRALGVRRAHITNYARTYYRHQDALFLDSSQVEYLNFTVQKLRQELEWPELQCNAAIFDYSQPENRSHEDWEKRTSCSGGFSSCAILPDGDIILCEQVPHDERFVVGNVRERSLLDVWNSKELMDFIVPDKKLFIGTACADCNEFDTCHRIYGRCFRDAYFNYDRVYAPSPRCPRSDPGIRVA
jgi:radical SAM protein with 4Fe4S-binding SPASM domain